jgi:glycerol-3-phosphate cytidylyltransferase-like family protein
VLHLLPVEPRPDGYSPLGVKNLEPKWVARLGQSGTDCFDAIKKMDVNALGASFNETMLCWEKLLPHVVAHPLIKLGLEGDFESLSKTFSGRDVLRLRRRLSAGRVAGKSSRRIASHRAHDKPMSTPKTVVVSGAFDDLKSRGIRFLEEASKLGELTVMLWNDDLVRARTNASPKFPEAERCYFLQSIRFISHVKLVNWPHSNHDATPHIFVVEASQNNAGVKAFCAANQIELCEISEKQLQGFPEAPAAPQEISARKKVIVTGSFDWFHSGHVRFLEEVSRSAIFTSLSATMRTSVC